MPSSSANINVRVDGDVKNRAQDVFSSLGMDMSTAINIFLRQAIRKKGIPFELVMTDVSVKTPKLGCLKGQITESDDHDWFEPMEDFKEYM
jgi:DNA-damage-inducible protein J